MQVSVNGTIDQLIAATENGDLRMYADLVKDYVRGLIFEMDPQATYTLTISRTPTRFSMVLVKGPQ